jgi:hypothetical protein
MIREAIDILFLVAAASSAVLLFALVVALAAI